MKKVGEILAEKRKSLGLSLKEVEKATRIRQNFLEAIEKNEFSLISSTATVKGFLRNYAQFLGLSPENILAVFRRDFQENEKGQIIPRGIVEPIEKEKFFWTPKLTTVLFVVLSLIGIGFFLGKTYLKIFSGPSLKVFSPKENETFQKSVIVSGQTDKDATLKIDGTPVLLDEKGRFKEEVVLPRGENVLVIEAVNRQGKKKTVSVKIRIE